MTLYDWLPARKKRGELLGRDSLGDMTSLQTEMNRMFDDFFSGFDIAPFRGMEGRLPQFSPKIDVKESKKEITVSAELPGMKEKDISINLEDELLTLTGEKKEEKTKEEEDYYHREVSYGSFRRVIPLGAKVNVDKVKANFKKGVLKITLPKVPGQESGKGTKIEIAK